MASLQEQLKAAQIEKATEELRAIELKTWLKDEKLISRWDAEHDTGAAFNGVRVALSNIPRTLTTHTSNCHGGVMIAALNKLVHNTVNNWAKDDSREPSQHEG